MKLNLLPLAAAITLALNPLVTLAEEQSSSIDTKDQNIEKITIKGRYTVNERIDTATGLGLSLRETPQSVSVLTADRIQDQGLETVIDTVLATVGVSSKEADNVRNTMQARGFDITNYQIDGVPLSWSLGGDSGETIADVSIYDRVEFVRGSTGLLTGAGDPSASINLVRKHADSTELTGYVDASYGSWDNRQLSADVSSGLNKDGTLRGRVVAKYSDGDSYSDLYSNEKNVFYGVLEGDITSDTLLRVGGSYQKNTPKAPVWGGLPGQFSNGKPTDWDESTTTAASWTYWDTESTNLFANMRHNFGNGLELLIDYNRLEYTQHSKLLYLYGDLDEEMGSGLDSWPYKSSGKSSQDSFDVQLKGDYNLFSREHDFVIGALYSKQTANTDSYEPLTDAFLPVDNFYEWNGVFAEPNWSDEPTVEQNMDTEQRGYYAASRINITDDFNIIAGGRIASWQRSGISYDVNTDYGDDNVFIPYVGALYDITEQYRVYFSYTDIFQPQNAQDRNGDFLDPTEGSTYELGLKSTYLEDTLHVSFAVFRIEQDNLAQDDIDDNGNVIYVPGSVITKAQVATNGIVSKGFELEVVGRPVDGWDINAGYSQFEAENANNVDVNTDHPRKQFKLFTTYNLGDFIPQLTVGGGVSWQSKTYAGSVSQTDYTLVDLMARYAVNESISFQLNVENLLDEKYYNYTDSGNEVRFGAPRNATLSVNYKF